MTNHSALVIAGSGRGGTTWVLDAVAKANRLRPIFEPLNPLAIREAQPFANRYIPVAAEMPNLKMFLSELFDGRFNSVWTDFRIRKNRLYPSFGHLRNSYRAWKALARRYPQYATTRKYPQSIVKFIRANLMLGWIQRTFDARIVLVVRHPGAVIESKLRCGRHIWDPYPLLEQYRKDSLLWDAYLKNYAHLFSRRVSLVEAYSLLWCIENQLPLRDAKRHEYVIVFYERLLDQPDIEWARIVDGLGLTTSPGSKLRELPSQQSSVRLRGDAFYGADYRSWLDRVSNSDLLQINEILQEMEVSVYDAFDPLPKPSREPGTLAVL